MANSQCGFIFQVQSYAGLRCHRQTLNAVKLKDLALYTDNIQRQSIFVLCGLLTIILEGSENLL